MLQVNYTLVTNVSKLKNKFKKIIIGKKRERKKCLLTVTSRSCEDTISGPALEILTWEGSTGLSVSVWVLFQVNVCLKALQKQLQCTEFTEEKCPIPSWNCFE